MHAYLFFKKVQRKVNVRSLVFAMKNSYIMIKDTKQRYLKKYIFNSATKIQSIFRGHYARKIKAPIRRKIKDKRAVVEAAALGWKTRRMLKVKEVKGRICQIRDFENAEEETLAEAMKSSNLAEKQSLANHIDGLRLSRTNTIVKLINLFHKLSEKGLWLTYLRAEDAGD